MYIRREAIKEIFQHALETYPEECCGVVTGDAENQTVHACRNIQNTLHAGDPEKYPRDSKTAYVIDRGEFDGIVSSAKERGHTVVGFYHSHTDHEAYFSVTDVEAQTVFGEPEFPDAVHMVVSIMGGKFHDVKCYKWDRDRKDFAGVEAED